MNTLKLPKQDKAYDLVLEDDENLFELEIKNLDTNEIFKMQIPVSGESKVIGSLAEQQVNKVIEDGSSMMYASRRKHNSI